jgi:hypothetical protein
MLQWERNKKQQMKESDLIKHLISKKYTTEQIMQFVLRFRELQKEKLSLQEFLAIQKEIEPKWSYEEKFFQKVINDYSYFLSSQQEIDFFLLEAPARTGKTELISGFGVPYIISQYKNVRIAIVAGNAALKRKLRKVITRIIKSKAFYDKYKIKIEIDNANEVTTSNGCLLFFTTILSQIPTGEGFHFIILEDAVTHTTITSEAKKENVYEQVDAFLTRTQDDPRTKLIVNNHRMATEDLSTRLIERYEEVNAKVLRITMPYQFSQDIIEKDIASNEYVFNAGEFLISRFNEKTKNLILAKIGKESFETQYQQNPTQSTGIFFKPYHFENLTPLQDIINQEGFYYISVDPASSDGKNADFTGIALMKYHPVKKKIYLQEIFSIKPISDNATLSSNQVINLISSLYKKYSTQSLGCQVLIEINGVGAYMPNILVEKGIPLSRIKTIKRSSSMRSQGSTNAKNLKESMALDIATRIEHGTLVLPKLEESSGMYNFKKQLLDFPNGKNDDMVDAVSNILYFLNESNKFGRVDDYSKVELNSPFN